MKNNLGANIKIYRKSKGFTQEELAGMLGVTPQAVSRWEQEVGMPDVSMIVPIAQALNITTDALLGYHMQSQDDRISEAVFAKMKEMEDVENPGLSTLKVCEYLAGEANKNPMNFDILLKYVQNVAGLSYYIDMEHLLDHDPQKAEAILEDGIRKGITIIRYAGEMKRINKAHYALAWIYIHKKDFDNAREHVNVLPTLEGHCIKEELNMSLVFFEKGFEAVKDTSVAFNRLLFDFIARQVNTLTTHYCYFGTLEEALEICDWCEGVLKAYAANPAFVTDVLPWVFRKFYFSKMSAYLKAGKEDKAKEICDNYLRDIREKGIFSEEEYKSVEKEFKEKIYIL
ncbi:MAG: helix-turn-helix transcriptional regulator [Lachnospiraceae bacterium]|nr:helix-turn-helix transcriptional regulator [Lachnospiraceae bacterium]